MVPAGLLLLFASASACAFTTPFQSEGLLSVKQSHPSIEFASQYVGSSGDQKITGPELELAWRLDASVQLNAAMPFVFDASSGQAPRFAYGSTELALAWRLLDGSHSGFPTVGVAPELDLPAATSGHHLGPTHLAGYVPVILTETLGRWDTYVNIARDINPGPQSRSAWFYGVVASRSVNSAFSIGGEVFHQGASSPGSLPTDGFNIGGHLATGAHQSCYFSIGRGFLHADSTDRLSAFLGYALTL